ncbi:oxidoreductase [Bordetella genomosp. 5]|uniref:Oxidoreductase n=2 Tax=Bordetella genomosp. 5 TaxID=1395608 RepID=A0A261TWF6_9BORD|nr:oxidoreductase [Bordetella genomosp. 5]
MNVQRPLALVTGSSSGIGLELAKQCASHGYDVAISGSSDQIFNAAEELKQLGANAYPYKADAATFEGVEGFWQFVSELSRPVEAAVLNVGIAIGGPFAENSLEDDLRVVAINVTGTVHMAKRVVQHMVRNGKGKILIVSSVSATTPTPYESVYGPSKAFGFSFAETIREELRGTGVSVTALLPGATNTKFHENAGLANSPIGKREKFDKAIVGKMGYEALMGELDHVVSGDESTLRSAIENRLLSEPVKAQRHAKATKLFN